MSRYIDVDEVLEQIRKKLGIKSLDYLLEAERQIVDVIQSAPSIDIVRCKECKYASDSEYTHCSYVTWYNGKDDYCSRGERKESE